MVWNRDVEKEELEERLIFALLRPAARLAIQAKLPARQLAKLVKLAYFQELRAQGLTLQEAAEVMDTSLPTASRLSKDLRQNFLRPEMEHQLPQRIEFMLWAQPMSRTRLKQVLHDYESQEVDDAMELMEKEGSIALRDPNKDVWGLEAPKVHLVKDAWPARLGSLNNILRNLGNTVMARFFRPEHPAFARSLNFRVPKERLDQLQVLYEQVIWTFLVDLDASARHSDQNEQVRLSLFWHVEEPEHE